MRTYYFFTKFVASFAVGLLAGLIGAILLGVGLAVAYTLMV